MEIKWNKDPKQVIKDLEKGIDDFAYRVIETTGKDIEKTTRHNFNRVISEIPADDPIIRVYSMPTFKSNNGWSKTILCDGNQVLFVEFGAGQKHKTETSSVAKINNQEIEYASRPYGIVGIGEWGQGRGKDDFWVYKTLNGRIAIGDDVWRISKSGTTYIKTSGIRPVRALWRAVGNSFRKLGSGRLKI